MKAASPPAATTETSARASSGAAGSGHVGHVHSDFTLSQSGIELVTAQIVFRSYATHRAIVGRVSEV